MRRLLLLSMAISLSACKAYPWCSDLAESLDPSVFGADAAAVAATDAFIRTELELGWDRPLDELGAAARALGATDAAELAVVIENGCFAGRDVARFAQARGMRAESAESYLASRFGVTACADR
ncbi:MAG: hypothetical protein ACHQ2Z_07520 [Elusimicrobiota bacterium]